LKKISLILGVIALVMTTGLGISRIMASFESSPVRVSTACELKSGTLMAIDDGYSYYRFCEKFGRKVVLGNVGVKNIAFIDPMGIAVLTTEGEIWQWFGGEDGWNHPSEPTNVPIPVEKIAQWTGNKFLETNGDVWVWVGGDPVGHWSNIGHPE